MPRNAVATRKPKSSRRRGSQQKRAERLVQGELSFIPNDEFEHLTPDDVEHIDDGVELYRAGTEGAKEAAGGSAALLQSRPLLTAAGERHLFRKLNFYKFHAENLRSQIDPDRPDRKLLDEIEHAEKVADETRNHIAECNLRLVVSVASNYVSPLYDLDEMISEGHLILLNAVDKFDYARGFRFSTYATHSIQRHLFRWQKRQYRRQRGVLQPDPVIMQSLPEPETDDHDRLDQRASARLVRHLDRCLNERERYIVRARFGIGDDPEEPARTLRDLSSELKISKERVRQLQITALAKLRDSITPAMAEWLPA